MSKKTSYICNRNFLQTNFNNKSTNTNAICYQTLSIQKPSEENKEINCHRKLLKTANNNQKYATSKDKFRAHNCHPNNRARLTATTTRRNVTKSLHFNMNALGLKGVAANPKSTECKSCKYSKNYLNGKQLNCHHNLHMYCKCSAKLLNLSQPQQHHRNAEQDFEKSKMLKIYTPNAPCYTHQHECQSYVHVIPLKMDKNLYCHHSHLHVGGNGGGSTIFNKLQLHDKKTSVSSSTQQSKYHHHHDSQLTFLPQVSQHPKQLLGIFEVLPPLFLLKSTSGKFTENHVKYHHSLFESIQHKSFHCCADVHVGGNPKMLQPLPLRHKDDFKLDYDNIFRYLKTKTKPSDRDVIFGNACLLLRKHYGWETSRLEWLLQLEEQHQNHHHHHHHQTHRMANQ
ncbi:hypothetical protein CVS40_1011 [Lucilia cuprina]|nr:hypothetical protein CVS40_1011 [Lucilia cuprina]